MMRWNWKTVLTIIVWLAWAAAPSALRADPLNVAVTQSSQTVTQGTLVVTFDATITNPSPTDTIWLNSDDSTRLSLLTSVDDSPFNMNAPLFLDPAGSSGLIALFNVDLAPGLAPGTYTGVFSILGGADGGTDTAFADLADVNFTVIVTGPTVTPEPGTILLLATGLVVPLTLKKRMRQMRF